MVYVKKYPTKGKCMSVSLVLFGYELSRKWKLLCAFKFVVCE